MATYAKWLRPDDLVEVSQGPLGPMIRSGLLCEMRGVIEVLRQRRIGLVMFSVDADFHTDRQRISNEDVAATAPPIPLPITMTSSMPTL